MTVLNKPCSDTRTEKVNGVAQELHEKLTTDAYFTANLKFWTAL